MVMGCSGAESVRLADVYSAVWLADTVMEAGGWFWWAIIESLLVSSLNSSYPHCHLQTRVSHILCPYAPFPSSCAAAAVVVPRGQWGALWYVCKDPTETDPERGWCGIAGNAGAHGSVFPRGQGSWLGKEKKRTWETVDRIQLIGHI